MSGALKLNGFGISLSLQQTSRALLTPSDVQTPGSDHNTKKLVRKNN
jgi:hypothetical protein